jgi:tight adherence protein B
MMSSYAPLALKLVALACIAGALCACAAAVVLDATRGPARLFARYARSLDRRLDVLSLELRGVRLASLCLLGGVLLLLAGSLSRSPALLMAALLAPLAPYAVLGRLQRARVRKLETRLDQFLLSLANALRASPNIPRALASVQPIAPAPFDRELERLLREMRVGSTLEQAFQSLSERVRSFQLDAALSALLIGRQVGGNVSVILEASAASLREMARLEGVLRAKTAEGRVQATVLALFPALLVFSFNSVKPGYFKPLTETSGGLVVLALAVGAWIASVLLARKILDVEL